MKNNLWIVILIVIAVMVASCGDSEPAPVEETDEQTEVDEATEVEPETVEDIEIVEEPESQEMVSEEETVEEEVEAGISTITLPEPWPVDFLIPDCFEVISNEVNENGNQVILAAVPEGTDRPGVWDLGRINQ